MLVIPRFAHRDLLIHFLHHAKRHEAVKRRKVVESWRRCVDTCLISVICGSIAFDKCEQREATGLTGFPCSSDLFQNIDGFVLRKSAAIQNIPVSEFLTRARRL